MPIRLAAVPMIRPTSARPKDGSWSKGDWEPANTGLRKSLNTWSVLGTGNWSGHATITESAPRMTTGINIGYPASLTPKPRAVCGSPWNTVK